MLFKTVRVVFSLLVFSIFIIFFIIGEKAEGLMKIILGLQLIPSFLKFLTMGIALSFGFIAVLLLTFIFGRFYCSTICPLGTIQDIIIFIKKKFIKKNEFIRNRNITRKIVYIIIFLSFFTGSMSLIGAFDPYSIFIRAAANIFKPLSVYSVNFATERLKDLKIYTSFHFKLHKLTLELFLFSLSSFVLISVMTVFKNRWFCNTLCPAGTVLGGISKFSIFNFNLDEKKCISCKKCEKACKANCIDISEKKIELSQCVSCFNCTAVCPNSSIKYKIRIPSFFKKNDASKRTFLKTLFAGALLSQSSFSLKKNNGAAQTITPPGSESIKNFTEHCISCHLCVSSCPTKVLSPTFMKYGLTGFMQPEMNYSVSFCDYECNACSKICPTGAIKPLVLEEKKLTQIGSVILTNEKCIVYRDGKDCGACAEHCPTKAVYMKPHKNIYGPVTNTAVCIGCGACEYVCPAKPEKAIIVKSIPLHKKVDKNINQENEQIYKRKSLPPLKKEDDFPF